MKMIEEKKNQSGNVVMQIFFNKEKRQRILRWYFDGDNMHQRICSDPYGVDIREQQILKSETHYDLKNNIVISRSYYASGAVAKTSMKRDGAVVEQSTYSDDGWLMESSNEMHTIKWGNDGKVEAFYDRITGDMFDFRSMKAKTVSEEGFGPERDITEGEVDFYQNLFSHTLETSK